MTLPRTHAKRLTDREQSKQTLLGRAKRIAHILSGIPTGSDAWTEDDHRDHVFGADRRLPPGPPPIDPARRAILEADLAQIAEARRDEALPYGPARPRPVDPPQPSPEDRARWDDWRSEIAPIPRSSKLSDSLPPSYGIDPMDRGTHQAVANQAAKVISALESCGHWRNVYACPSHGAWAATARCGHRLCTPCAVVRRSDLLARYASELTNLGTDTEPAAPMLTLTQKTEPGEWLSDAFARLQERHTSFVRSVRLELHGCKEINENPECFDWRGKGGRARGRARRIALTRARANRDGIGGLSSFEATPRPRKTWHAHAHILIREPAHVPDAWTVPHWTKARPLDPWRFRYLWAVALVDGRTKAGVARIAQLAVAYHAGRKTWLRKQRAQTRLLQAKAAETKALKAWAKACARTTVAGFEVPAVPSGVDLKLVHPAEGVKYLTKGYDTDPKRGAPLTDWHLWQLLIGTYYLRRTIPWGTLYNLPKEPEKENDEQDDEEHRPCPHCGAKSAPIPRDQWKGSGAAPDTLLIALRLDRRPYSPRGPPLSLAPESRRVPLPALGFSRAELDLMLALGEVRAPSPQARQDGELLAVGSLA